MNSFTNTRTSMHWGWAVTLAALLSLVIYLSSLPFYLLVLALLFLTTSLGYIGVGLFSVILLKMLDPYGNFAEGLNPLLTAGPQAVFIAGALFNRLLYRSRSPLFILFRKVELFWLGILLVLPFSATLASGYYDYVHLLVLFYINIAFLVITVSALRKELVAWRWLWAALILGPVFALYLLVAIGGGWPTFSRLSLDGNVRVIANPIGTATLLLAFVMIWRNHAKLVGIDIAKRPFVTSALLIFFLVALAATASRGVMLAIVISTIGAFMVMSIFPSKKVLASNRQSSLAITPAKLFTIVGISFVVVSGAILGARFLSFEALQSRLSMDLLDDGRLRIWASRLEVMTTKDWLFGTGINRFHTLGDEYIGMYAHSVFLDFLVSFGFLGFFGIGLMVSASFWKAFRLRSPLGLMIGLYLITSFSLHGSITTFTFWTLLSVSIAIPKLVDSSGSRQLDYHHYREESNSTMKKERLQIKMLVMSTFRGRKSLW